MDTKTRFLILAIVSSVTFVLLVCVAIYLIIELKKRRKKILEGEELFFKEKNYREAIDTAFEVITFETSFQLQNNSNKDLFAIHQDSKEKTKIHAGARSIISWEDKSVKNSNDVYVIFMHMKNNEPENGELLLLKFLTDEIELKPLVKTRNLEFLIWKMKAATIKNEPFMLEKLVFYGILTKTMNFSRSAGRYFKLRVSTTDKEQNVFKPDQYDTDRQLVLTLTVTKETITYENNSLVDMQATVTHEYEEKELVNDMLTRGVRGTQSFRGWYAFSVTNDKVENEKVENEKDTTRTIARLLINEKKIIIESCKRLGEKDLYCQITTPQSPRHLDDSSTSSPSTMEVFDGKVISDIQLPRKDIHYSMLFFIDKKELTNEATSSYTMQ